jgi:hypothetical protein
MKSKKFPRPESAISRVCRTSLLLASAAILLAAPAVWGGAGPPPPPPLPAVSSQEDASLFGQLNQNDPGIDYNAGACAPTAAIDGLTYLANTQPAGTFAISPNSPAEVDCLESFMQTTDQGTYFNLQAPGIEGYLSTPLYLGGNPAPSIDVEGGSLNWNFVGGGGAGASLLLLWGLLNNHQAVQLQITPVGGGQDHMVCLTGIKWDPTTGSGTAYLIDPNIFNQDGTTDPFMTTLSQSADGNFLTISDIGYDSQFDKLDINGGTITGFDDESVVPEPATIIAGASMLLPFGAQAIQMLRKRRAS